MKYHFNDNTLPTVIIIGGGFAGLELIKKLNNKPYRVILIDKHNYHTFQPLLYQVASAGLSADSIAFPFRRKVGSYTNCIFRMAEVTAVETTTKTVITSVGNYTYDYLIIASGATTNYYGNAQLEKYTLPLKTIPEALNIRSEILQEFEQAILSTTDNAQKKSLNFVIVGGGPTGVELAGALAEIKKNVLPKDYRELDFNKMQVQLIEGGDRVLAGMTSKSSALAKKYLENLGVEVLLKTQVKSYNGNDLELGNGLVINTSNVIWAAGVRGATLDGINANAVTKGNRYIVDAYNLIIGYDAVFAIGDIAYMTADKNYPNGHPGMAQVAMQQAKNLANNLIQIHYKKNKKEFVYHNKGSMATIGRHRAVVDMPQFSFGGYIAWYAWMFIHLMALVGFRNRFMVFMHWMWNYFSYDRALRLIIRPFEKPL